LVNSASPRTGPRTRIGVIDVGSNTVLLLVIDASGARVLDEAHITRLAQGLATGARLGEEPGRRTAEVVRKLARRARAEGADPLVAVGTDALRRASDGVPFLERLRSEAGLEGARVLSGEEEAAFAIEASRRAARPGRPLVVIDVGGGSTELAWSTDRGGVGAVSLPVGSVRLTEALVSSDPPTPDQIEAVREAARGALRGVVLEGATAGGAERDVTAVAGTATTLAALDQRLEPYDPDRVEGYRIGRDRLEAWVERLSALKVAQRRVLPGMEAGRADVLPAGLVVLSETLAALGASRFGVSGRGVRYGVALRLLEQPEAVW
jgi:exopolyphosphatase/guanosine-5'-triphosphate,3'-diphosphate pyrophosphatase